MQESIPPLLSRTINKVLLCGSLFFGASLVVTAQDEDDEVEGDIYLLSPFSVDVSSDDGYRSTNSTSGTSLNTAIKDIPMSIEVLNAEFIEDTGATNFDEALAYSAGVFLEEFSAGDGVGTDGANTSGANEVDSADRSPSSRGGTGGRFANVTIIRGFNVPFQNRDGFRYGGLIAQYGTILGGIIDTANVERMEVVRGPNSLLYGIGVLSGIVNVIPKRPLSAPVQEVNFGIGSEGYLRGTVDVTGPLAKDFLGGQLNYRFATAYEERDHWTDWRGKELEYYVGQLTWQTEKLSLFLEGQYADQIETGIGSQFIYDNVNAAIDQNFRNEFGEQINWTKNEAYGGLPQTYRVTGPDTYHQRRESNFMANLDITPIENLTISAGMFMTDAKEDEFNVNISTLVNTERALQLKGVLTERPNDPNTENPQAIIDWLDENVTIFQNEHVPSPEGDRRDLRDYRMVRYWWENDPEDTTTEQYRVRATYSFEADLFGKNSRHTFLVGRHDIKDEADFTIGSPRINWQYADKEEISETDILQVRNINDHSVIRYDGEPTGMPGRQFRNVEVWFTGHYALYQGQLWEDKIGIIAGARHDRFHSRDRIWDRFDEIAEFGSDYDGPALEIAPASGIVSNPNNNTFGFFPLPDGVSEYIPNPDEAEKTTTRTLALNYKITDDLTIYGVRAEGLTPNTGARDGNLIGLPSETSTSEEIGIKFDINDGKFSGTISAYRIERENAVWRFQGAPAPARWVGGVNAIDEEANEDTGFDPRLITDGVAPLSYSIDRHYFDEEGIEIQKVLQFIRDDEGNIVGRQFDWPEGLLGIEGTFSDTTNPRNAVYLQYDKLDVEAIDKNGDPTGRTWRYFLEKAFADRERSASVFNAQAGPDDFDPMLWGRTRGTLLGLNTSINNSRGANVTYTDEATGYDMQFIYSPLENWQLIFAYAHTEREATGSFNLVDVVDPETGVSFGTEYDVWVRTFGRAAFGLEESDTDGDGVIDTVTKDGQPISMGDVSPLDLIGGLQGASLYTGSEDAASLWSNYRISEGALDGLGLGLGVIYTGPAQTSIPIGGTDLAENRFGTPPTEERWNVNAAFRYSWTINDLYITARLNVYNVLDDTEGLSIANYVDDGVPIMRRTENFYAPRSYRLSVGIDF